MKILGNLLDRLFGKKTRTDGKKADADRILLWIVAGAFLFTTAWILIAGHYAVPNQDDYYSGYEAYALLCQGEQVGLGELVSMAWDKTVDTWYTWGGNYTSFFFCGLQPFVYNEDLYQFQVVFLLVIIIAGFLYFNAQVLRRFPGLKKEHGAILNLLFTMMALQFVPSPYEAYYWFVGSFYNTCGLAFGLIVLGLLFSYERDGGWYKIPIAVIFALLSGGCSYSSFLVQTLIMILYLADLWFIKNNAMKVRITATLIALFWLACSLFSALSPGNASRGAYSEKMGAVRAILYSLAYAADFLIKNMSVMILLAMILLAVIMIPVLKNTDWKFRYPMLFVILTFGIYASTFTPTLYAQSSSGQPRLHNIIFWYLLYMLFADAVYITGWILRKREHKTGAEAPYAKYLLPALTALILVSSVTGQHRAVWVQAEAGFFDSTLMSFKGFMDEWEDFFKEHEGQDIVVGTLPVPEVFDGIKLVDENPSYWINDSVCTYYRLSSIRLDPELPMGTIEVYTE